MIEFFNKDVEYGGNIRFSTFSMYCLCCTQTNNSLADYSTDACPKKKPTTLVSRRKKKQLLFNDIKALYINRSLDFCRY